MTTEERFWQKVQKTDSCWNWTACLSRSNNGVLRDGDKNVTATRFSYELANGVSLGNVRLQHTCRNTLCVNPSHLYIASVEGRLLSKVQKTETCWLWLADKVTGGYGRIKVGRGLKLAHRVSYELFVGKIPNGMQVLHSCDNPPCVNPKHLFLGNDRINVDDKIRKKRHCFGENHPKAKITEKDVFLIRSSDLSKNQLAKAFGLTAQSISDILLRKSWRHL